MIKFETIQRAKDGDENAINDILNYYLPRIRKICRDDDFMQLALISIYKGINTFKFR